VKSVFFATAVLFAAPSLALVPAPSQFVAFGDSFIDSGNIAASTGNTVPDPARAYWNGRFSDGANWLDYLSYYTFGSAARASLAGGGNFAFGGARAAQDDIISVVPPVAIPGFQTQLLMSGIPFAPAVDPDALYIIAFGNNDVSALQGSDADREGLTALQYQTAFIDNMVGAIQLLDAKGAQNILVTGIPNPLEAEGQMLQGLLTTALNNLEPTLTNATLYRFDFFSFFFALEADPTQFGLPANIDLVNRCLPPMGPPTDDCSNYLSFDGIHVTKGVQLAIAREIGDLVGLSTVPEPQSWAMMIAGFGLVGFSARRQRRSAARV
jgi:phospholipase/lecithinase/hemolysin